MGRTIPSYRIAAELERRKWKTFRQELDESKRKVKYQNVLLASGIGIGYRV